MRVVFRPPLVLGTLLALAALAGPAAADGRQPWLPHSDLDIDLQVDQHRAVVRERVPWPNRHERAAESVVFNVHSHYTIADQDVGFLAKMLEILRLAPSDAMDFD